MASSSLESAPRPMVTSIVQAIAVLRHLGALAAPAGVTHIARSLGISPSSCFNILKTLAAEELVSFDSATKTYALGIGSVDLARLALARDAVVTAARRPMDALAAQYDAAVGLWRVSKQERLMLVALSESESATRIHMVVGQRQPASAGATGRAVLAARGADDDSVAAAFAALRWQQAPALADYLAQVHEARAQGWALDIDQINRGISTAAASLTDANGEVRFCLSASMFTGRDSPGQLEEIGRAVRDTADRIAKEALG